MDNGNDGRIAARLRAVLRLSGPYWGRIAIASALVVSASLVSLILPMLTGRFIDALTLHDATLTIPQIAVIMVVAMAVQGSLAMVGAWIIAWVDERVLLGIRKRAFAHLLKLPIAAFQDRRKGELVSRVGGDVEIVGLAGPQNLVAVIQATVTIIGITTAMGLISLKLLGLACVGLPLFIPILYFFGKRTFALSRTAQDLEAEICGEISESVQHAVLIRSFNAEARMQSSFDEILRKACGLAMKHNLLRMLYRPATALIAFSATMVVLFVGSGLAQEGVINTGDLVAFILYVGMLVGALSMLVSCIMGLAGAAGAASRLFDLMQLPTEENRDFEINTVLGKIELKNVCFRYREDGLDVLKDLSFHVDVGETVAISGPSGCGKSTLLKVLCGFCSPTSGTALFDGNDLSTVSLDGIRSKVAYLEQEPHLVYGTVRENLLYGDPAADDDRLVMVAKQAQAHDFISSLPDGYDTLIGDDGVKLSAGQRHRLCLTRTLLKDAPIMLLDEPGVALDRETEDRLIEGLRQVVARKTCIIVAHDPTVIAIADRVVEI